MSPDDAIWFTLIGTDNQSSKIGRITTSGTISEFGAPENLSQLHDVTNGPDGNLWYIVDPRITPRMARSVSQK